MVVTSGHIAALRVAPERETDGGDLDDVDGALELKNQPGDKVIDDILQAEADAHAERAGQHRELVKLDTARVDGEEEDQEQQQVMQRGGDQLRHAARQVQPAEQLFAQ